MKPLFRLLLTLPFLITGISSFAEPLDAESITRPLKACVDQAGRVPGKVALWDLEISQQPVTGPIVLSLFDGIATRKADVRALSVFKKNRPKRDAMPPEAARLERIDWRNFFLNEAELTIRIAPKKTDGFYRTWEIISEISADGDLQVSCGPPLSFCEDGTSLAPSCAALKEANCAKEGQCLDLTPEVSRFSAAELSIGFEAICKQDECSEQDVRLYCGLRLPNFSMQGQQQDIFIALFPSTVAFPGLGKTPRSSVRVSQRETIFPNPQLGWTDDLRLEAEDAKEGTIRCWLVKKGQGEDAFWPMLFDYSEILNEPSVDPVSLRNTIGRLFGRNKEKLTLIMPGDYAEQVIRAQEQEWVDRLIGKQQVNLDNLFQ